MPQNAAAYRGASTCSQPSTQQWIEDVGTWVETNWEWFDPSHAHQVFWPDRPYPSGMEVLVAGCGPSQAAVIAYNNPQARVTAVDTNEAALNHTTYLRHKHKLLNLDANTLRPLPVEEVATYGKTFDLIIASGVLEHVDSPEKALSALADVLGPTGVVALTLPARRLVNAPCVERGPYRAFTAGECLDLVHGAGLEFQEWFLKANYYPPLLLNPDDEFMARVDNLPERQIFTIIESLANTSGRHLLVACRPERVAASYRIDFHSTDAANYVPGWRHRACLSDGFAVRPGLALPLDPVHLALAEQIDGQHSTGAIAARLQMEASEAVQIVMRLWQMDFVAVQL